MPDVDLKGIPTHECLCGCDTFITAVKFDDYHIAWYTLQGKCYACGNMVTLPCEVDRLEPATINLTCPLCEQDTDTRVLQDDDPIIARCDRCTYLYVAT
jgi:hypothetical protein